jgi:hypothetical protein
VIVLRDEDGAILRDDSTTRVRVSLGEQDGEGDAPGKLGGNLTVTARAGIVTFEDITLEGADNTLYTLVFTAIGTSSRVESDPVMVMTDPYAAAVRSAFGEAVRGFVERRAERIFALESDAWHLDRRRESVRDLRYQIDISRRGGGAEFRLGLQGEGDRISGGSAEARASEVARGLDLAAAAGLMSADGRTRLWASVSSSERVDGTAGAARTEGEFRLVSIGMDRLVNDRLALGLIVQADRMREARGDGGIVSGRGWMAGPYLSAEIAQGLFFSARAAAGESGNMAELDPMGDGRRFTARFTTNRTLWRASLRGQTEIGRIALTPALDFGSLRERIPAHAAVDEWHSVALEGATVRADRLALSALAEIPLGPSAGAATLSIRPEWSATRRPGAQESSATRAWSFELGLRSGADSAWSHEFRLRHDRAGGGSSATSLSVVFSRSF